ncbi:MAG: cell division protein ZapA [Gemmatimonadaceae bacterium]
MSGKKATVRVTIAGEQYSLRTDAPPEHTRAVATYLDAMIKSVMNSGLVVESDRAAILAALQITDELFRERAEREALAGSMRELSADVRRWLPPAKRGDEPR